MIENFSKIDKVKGTLRLPGDKSISHRAVMFSSLAKGRSEIFNCLKSEDIISTINAFRSLGIEIKINDEKIIVYGRGKEGLREADGDLYLGNSGTTTRLLAGILATQKFKNRLTGDPSLSSRPMQRIITPLKLMGAKIKSNEGKLPLEIFPAEGLVPIEYELPVASAQIKSCVLLAGLFLENETVVIEKERSRNHTELMLNLKIEDHGNIRKIFSSEKNFPISTNYQIPSDISTAAFFIVLTLIAQNSELLIPNVSLNPTRIGIIKILQEMGGTIDIENISTENGEVRGDIFVKSSSLKNIEIPAEVVPNIIDEIPILSIAGLFADGKFEIKNAKELRFKESDRINSVCENIKQLGIDVEEYKDGFSFEGYPSNNKVIFESNHDHRIAMAFSIFSLLNKNGGSIKDFECVSISNPDFISQIKSIVN